METSHPPAAKPLVILVAEDDDTDFLFLHSMLKKAGTASLFRTRDGEETVNYFKGRGRYADRSLFPVPDILLVDLRLPHLSGHEVLEWLLNHPLYRQVRKFVLAGSDTEADRLRAREAGAAEYFVKPLCLGHLAVLLDRSEAIEWSAEPAHLGSRAD